MSRNRLVVKPVEHTESEEDDDASSGEEESDSEPEQTQTQTQRSSAKPQQTPQKPPPPPSSSEESGSETESESDESASNANPKPVAEPQTISSNGAKKPAAAKRPAAAVDVATPKDAKKNKTNANGPETSEKKSVPFQRVFTEDDEIVLLRGMAAFRSEKKSDPAKDSKGFQDFMKDKFHTEISVNQVQDKIRRLKTKYENNKRKEEHGKASHFAKSHEQLLYDLSKLAYPDVTENGVEGSPKKNAVDVGELNSGGGSRMEEMVLKFGREAFEAGKGTEGENDWRKLRVEELKLYLKQLEIRAAQAKLVLGLVNP